MKIILFALIILTFASIGRGQTVDTAKSNQQHKIVVYQDAAYPGGTDRFYRFITLSIRYPEIAIKNKIEGVVNVLFTIDVSGKVTDVIVQKSVSPELDAEAKRVVESSPLWKPARIDGRIIPQNFTIGVPFKLN